MRVPVLPPLMECSCCKRDNVIDSVCDAGIYSYYQNNSMFNGNDINLLRGVSATMYGIYLSSYTSNIKILNNKVHDLNQFPLQAVLHTAFVSPAEVREE